MGVTPIGEGNRKSVLDRQHVILKKQLNRKSVLDRQNVILKKQLSRNEIKTNENKNVNHQNTTQSK